MFNAKQFQLVKLMCEIIKLPAISVNFLALIADGDNAASFIIAKL